MPHHPRRLRVSGLDADVLRELLAEAERLGPADAA